MDISTHTNSEYPQQPGGPLNPAGSGLVNAGEPQNGFGFFLAQTVSVLLHPLLMPTYICAVLLTQVPNYIVINPEGVQAVLGFIALVTCLLPAILIGLMRLLGIISSITLWNAKERSLPLFLTFGVYLAASFLVWKYLPGLRNLHIILFLVTFNVLLCALITPVYKISAHAMGVSGAVGALMAITAMYPNEPGLLTILLSAIVLAGIACTARLGLNAHTPGQVAAGVLTGYSTAFGAIIWWQL